jgi:hypothetical protein
LKESIGVLRVVRKIAHLRLWIHLLLHVLLGKPVSTHRVKPSQAKPSQAKLEAMPFPDMLWSNSFIESVPRFERLVLLVCSATKRSTQIRKAK